MGELSAVVLAAGQGTRMKSKLPKVLHKVCGVPMVNQVIRIIKNAGCTRCIAVTGFKEELVRKSLRLCFFCSPDRTAGNWACGYAGNAITGIG